MKKNSIQIIGILIVFLVISSCSKSLVYNGVKSEIKCSNKNGYWYNNKCWKDFDDDGILNSAIDSMVISEMKIISKSTFIIDNKIYPLIGFLPIEEDEGILFLAVYGTKDNYKTLVFPTGKKKMKNGSFTTAAWLFNGDAMSGSLEKNSKTSGTATVNIIDVDNLEIEITGSISTTKNGKPKDFTFKTNEAISGAGNSLIEIKGNEAYLSGDLGTITYWQIKDLIKNYPTIKTIVMTQISGSINDAVNMHTGRIIRENGFTTKVLSNSDIASGGVDLFCAGKERIVEKGAKIGVHSWCCVNDLTAIEIPKDHPAHKYQLTYFTMALGPNNGPAFYFYTLEASSFDNIHYMTDEEIKKWNIATDFVENK